MQDPDYRVLARKYRPETFADLVGQDALVRTLTAAFETGRVAQAYLLTGIRGTGKTTTARIIAKGLNCTGPDGTGGPTVSPCGMCADCTAIAAGRHVDVMEIDAASNTGVQNVRDVIVDTVAYGPSQGRYKIFVIDEVHMLSASAFNALLKTLEEPPAHVKFVLATTEVQKVPVTVLSRCQRFDLRRIGTDEMIALMARIAAAEGGEVTDDALALIARAAEGSARDATSLLDQAIARGTADAAAVRDMLGLADRGRTLGLMDMILRGDAAGALAELRAQYEDGADPLAALQGLAEAAHWVSVIKITPAAADDPGAAEAERDRGRAAAQAVPMRALTRLWQMLLKAIAEVREAPSAIMAAEMAVIRMTHVADLPSPDDLVRRLRDAAPHETRAPAPTPISEGPVPKGPGSERPASEGPGREAPVPERPARAAAPPPARAAGSAAAQARSEALAAPDPLARYGRFEDVVALIAARRDVPFQIEVEQGVRLVSYAPGRIEFEPGPGAAADLAQRLAARLQAWTGARWGVSVVSTGGAGSIAERAGAQAAALEAEAEAHPMVAAVRAAFPAAGRLRVHPRAAAAEHALPDPEDSADTWDPFEDD